MKMILVLALCLLCFPAALSLECYSCGDYPGSTEPSCNNPVVQRCNRYHDSCMSSDVTAEINGTFTRATIKNCSYSQYQCNSSFVCSHISNAVEQLNGTVYSCSVSCCYDDLCNGSGGGGPKPTAYPTAVPPGPDPQSRLKSYINTFQALLDEMRYIVDNELGGYVSLSSGKHRKHKGRNKKRKVLEMREKKRKAKGPELMRKALEAIKENLVKMAPNNQ